MHLRVDCRQTNGLYEMCTDLIYNHLLGHFDILHLPLLPDPCHLDHGVEDYGQGFVNDAAPHSNVEMTLPNEMT